MSACNICGKLPCYEHERVTAVSEGAWEAEWERRHPRQAYERDHGVADSIEMRDRDQWGAGYNAALSSQEEIVRAAKREALIGLRDTYDALPSGSWPGFYRMLASQLAECAPKPEALTAARQSILPGSTWRQSIPPGIHVTVQTVGAAGVSFRWSQGSAETATDEDFRIWFEHVKDADPPTFITEKEIRALCHVPPTELEISCLAVAEAAIENTTRAGARALFWLVLELAKRSGISSDELMALVEYCGERI